MLSMCGGMASSSSSSPGIDCSTERAIRCCGETRCALFLLDLQLAGCEGRVQIEYMVVSLDEEQHNARLSLRQSEILEELRQAELAQLPRKPGA